MLQITNKGIVIDRLDEIHKRLSDGFKTIYGEDINIDSDTPDGQMIGLFSQSLADINEVMAFMFQMLDPYRATGEWLEQRALYAGLVRRGAEYSYIHDAVIIGRENVTIPQNTLFIDGNRNRWVSLQTVTLNELGSAKISLRSESLGAFDLASGQDLTMETVIIGVDKVTLTTEAVPGAEEETDGQLLTRFMQSHAINNHDDREGIKAALLSLPDIKKVEVIENYTSEMDAVNGVPAHSMNAIVLGGNEEDIALAILKKKSGGCGLFGKISYSLMYEDVLREVKFDRPEIVNIDVSIVIERLKAYQDIDTDKIKNVLSETEFEIGESVYATRLICQVNSISGFYIKSITVNGEEKVDLGIRQLARILAENVEVLIE